jgi:hypothetical protein
LVLRSLPTILRVTLALVLVFLRVCWISVEMMMMIMDNDDDDGDDNVHDGLLLLLVNLIMSLEFMMLI